VAVKHSDCPRFNRECENRLQGESAGPEKKGGERGGRGPQGLSKQTSLPKKNAEGGERKKKADSVEGTQFKKGNTGRRNSAIGKLDSLPLKGYFGRGQGRQNGELYLQQEEGD